MKVIEVKWYLRRLMADKNIKVKDLKKVLQISNATMTKLRVSNTMPKIDSKTLTLLMNTLQCHLGDLIEVVYDSDTE